MCTIVDIYILECVDALHTLSPQEAFYGFYLDEYSFHGMIIAMEKLGHDAGTWPFKGKFYLQKISKEDIKQMYEYARKQRLSLEVKACTPHMS